MFRRVRRLVSRFMPPASPRAPVLPRIDPYRPFAVDRHDLCLADLSREALRGLIADLGTRADVTGCAVFSGDTNADTIAIIFAGNLERFFMLAVARNLRCPVIYFQDLESWWYQGSAALPDLRLICERFLVSEVGSKRALLFGQSSGAYAALFASTYLKGSTLVACSPQTFSDQQAKSRIEWIGVRAQMTPPGLLDLKERLSACHDATASRTIVIAASEAGNPVSAHFWMDYLHLLHLDDVAGLMRVVVNADSHTIVHSRVDRFADLLAALDLESASPVEDRNTIIIDFLQALFGTVGKASS